MPLEPARPRPAVPLPDAAAPLELAVEEGTELYLLLGLLLVGGFMTKEVSVVKNVASVSGGGAVRCGKGEFSRGLEDEVWRVKDCGIGAWKSCQSVHNRLSLWERWYLWKVDAEGRHVHAIQEGTEILVEARDGLVQQLEVHHVGFQISHGVAELSKCRLQGGEREVVTP